MEINALLTMESVDLDSDSQVCDLSSPTSNANQCIEVQSNSPGSNVGYSLSEHQRQQEEFDKEQKEGIRRYGLRTRQSKLNDFIIKPNTDEKKPSKKAVKEAKPVHPFFLGAKDKVNTSPSINSIKKGTVTKRLDSIESNLEKQEREVERKNIWLKEFMAGKKHNPFFDRKIPGSPKDSTHTLSLEGVKRNEKSVFLEAEWPSLMYYPEYVVDLDRVESESEKAGNSKGKNVIIDLIEDDDNVVLDSWVNKQTTSVASKENTRLTVSMPSNMQFWITTFQLHYNQLFQYRWLDLITNPIDTTVIENEKYLTSGGSSWVQRYSARLSHDFLTNSDVMKQVRCWLDRWKVVVDFKDDDEFEHRWLKDDDDDGEEYGRNPSKKVKSRGGKSNYTTSQDLSGRGKKRKVWAPPQPPIIVLAGPSGVGKTRSAYACARDVGYQVLEISAMMRRSGRDLTSLLGELSRNHVVNATPTSTSFFTSKPSTSPNLVILIDECDLLFQSDKNFFSTLTQLAQQTRRPFILTCNDPSILSISSDLIYLTLHLSPPPTATLLPFLQLICLKENMFAYQSVLIEMIQIYDNDIRKILMELESLCSISKNDTLLKTQTNPKTCLDHMLLDFDQNVLNQIKKDIDDEDIFTDYFVIDRLGQSDSKKGAGGFMNPSLGLIYPTKLEIESQADYSAVLDIMFPTSNEPITDQLNRYGDLLDCLSSMQTFNPDPYELDQILNYDQCHLDHLKLDVDETGSDNLELFHVCPNQNLFIDPIKFIPASTNKIANFQYSIDIKQQYQYSLINSLSQIYQIASPLLSQLKNTQPPLFEITSQIKSLITKAIPTLSIQLGIKSIYDISYYLVQLLHAEKRGAIKLRSQRTFISKRFQGINTKELDLMDKFIHFTTISRIKEVSIGTSNSLSRTSSINDESNAKRLNSIANYLFKDKH